MVSEATGSVSDPEPGGFAASTRYRKVRLKRIVHCDAAPSASSRYRGSPVAICACVHRNTYPALPLHHPGMILVVGWGPRKRSHFHCRPRLTGSAHSASWCKRSSSEDGNGSPEAAHQHKVELSSPAHPCTIPRLLNSFDS